jgi:hypothetical protein
LRFLVFVMGDRVFYAAGLPSLEGVSPSISPSRGRVRPPHPLHKVVKLAIDGWQLGARLFDEFVFVADSLRVLVFVMEGRVFTLPDCRALRGLPPQAPPAGDGCVPHTPSTKEVKLAIDGWQFEARLFDEF